MSWMSDSATRTQERTVWLAVGGVVTALALLVSGLNVRSWLAEQEATETETYTRDIARLSLDTGSGDLTVLASEDGNIHVERHMTWAYDKPDVVAEFTGDHLTLRADCGGVEWWLGDCEVDYVIRVPQDTDLDAETGSGRLRVRDLHGDVRAHTGSGGIDLSDLGAENALVDARTGSGAIDMNDVTATELSARTGSGSIDLRRVESDTTNLRTGSGSIDASFDEVPRDVLARTGSGSVEIAVPDDGTAYTVAVSTGSGDQDISVVDDPRASRTIQVETGSGAVSVFYFD